MSSHTKRAAFVVLALLAAAACSANGTVPTAQSGVSGEMPQFGADSGAAVLADNTSILKKLIKNVVIGSTVDPTNGDKGPHSVSIVQTNYGLKKGQLIACNFADSGGTAGNGTTVEVLNPQPSSSPKTFTQSSDIKGCDGAATTLGNSICASGMTAGEVACFDRNGNVINTYTTPFVRPLDDLDAHCIAGPSCLYNAEYIFGSDAKTGGIVDFSINNYGNPHPLEVAKGFAVNGKSGWSALGPAGLSYDPKPNEVYITDGVTNTVVVFTNASSLLVKDEIVVLSGGKTFKCKYHGKNDPCGKLIFAGSPLKAPIAMAVLPNHNLIVANGQGNELVEIDVSTKTVLATKVVDKGASPAIFGLAAIGSKDSNTALFYTDTNDNTIHELEQ